MSEEVKIEKPTKIEDVKLPTSEELGVSGFESGLDDFDVGDVTPDEAVSKKETVSHTDIEKRAMENGWSPKEEFKGDPNEFRSADYYMGKRETLEKVSSQSKKIKNLQSSIEQMTSVFQKNIEDGKRKEIEGLVDKRNTLITEGELEEVHKVDTQINEVNQRNQEFNQPDQPIPDEHRDAAQFVEDNKDWYNNSTPFNHSMVNKAQEVEMGIGRRNPELSNVERLSRTKDRMIQLYPDYFGISESKQNEPQKIEQRRTVDQPFETVSQNQSIHKPNSVSKITYANCPHEVKKVIHAMYKCNTNPDLKWEDYAQAYVDRLSASGTLTTE